MNKTLPSPCLYSNPDLHIAFWHAMQAYIDKQPTESDEIELPFTSLQFILEIGKVSMETHKLPETSEELFAIYPELNNWRAAYRLSTLKDSKCKAVYRPSLGALMVSAERVDDKHTIGFLFDPGRVNKTLARLISRANLINQTAVAAYAALTELRKDLDHAN